MTDVDASTPAPGSSTPEPEAYPHAVAVGLLVAVGLVLLDQLTKQLVEEILEPGRFVPWLGEHIGWQLVYNPGGAFGLDAPHWIFLVVTVAVLVLVTRVLPEAPSLPAAIAYGMLLAGAVGNVLDRLFRAGGEAFGSGYVVDFVAWGSFPRFNVADSSITVGFVLLVLVVLAEERREAGAVGTDEGPGDADHLPDDGRPGGDEPGT